ncbi:ParB N-terminal domain-containing protein [Rhodomicrobium vannielii ATCC 17100]|uniref:ParB/RepB/Spo0J family partition protein n=1 Tax=Rhodomicrobium vannielii TaxID=1069 RepID=UPI00191883F4|nr:ParB/RepB/Spo0J family partition protein [Rhodomicrobium vannielii]MBJ7532948.1 ParB N-terminal domain-containing protein [Rhodomicrobium vannielii ATCC 17100]
MARAKLTFSAPVTIALDLLEPSAANVRRVKPQMSIESLAESIARRGLLQSLSVRPILDEAGAETGRYRVQAGGRRLEALLRLVKQKRLAKNAPIPCLVKSSGIEEEDSLAENTDREALHPLDQFRAFQALADKGQPVEDIAAAFSVTPAVVRQRLKLASVSPTLLALYEEDALTLDLLMAFALSSDHARQEQVWEAIKQQRWLQSPQHIRRLLTENTVSARDARAHFVGLEAYQAAGGFVLRDLFAEDDGGYLTDPVLLQRLVNEKLEAEAAAIRAEGWKWVEAAEDHPYNVTYRMRPLTPVTPAFTEAEEQELEALGNEHDELIGSLSDDEQADAATQKRLDLIERRIAELETRAPVFAPEEVALAGAFVSIDSDGKLCMERGFVRPEDEPRRAGDGTEGDDAEDFEGSEAADGFREDAASVNSEDDEDDMAVLPERLVADLTTFRTLALRDAVANDPDAAMLALLHALTLKLLYAYGGHGTCVEISAHGLLPTVPKDARQTKPGRAIEDRTNRWKQTLPDDERELWGYLVELGQEERSALLAQLVSMTVNAVAEARNMGRNRLRHADQLAAMVNLDLVEAGFTPTVENYLGRITKAEILAAVTEACGEETASLLVDLKKKEMAAEAERLLAGTGWLPAPLRGSRPKPEAEPVVVACPANDDALPAFLEEEEAAA